MKESTRYGRLSPHSAPIEVGPHPRRPQRCPLESSNGAPHRMRSQRRFLSFIGETPAAEMSPMMTTDPYVTSHFFQALTLNSPWCSLLHNGGGMFRTAVSTPPAAPATLGDGCARSAGSGHGSAGHPLARIAHFRRGACPPPASLTPLASGCCKGAAESRILAAAAALLLQMVHIAAIQRLISAASRRRSSVRRAAQRPHRQQRSACS